MDEKLPLIISRGGDRDPAQEQFERDLAAARGNWGWWRSWWLRISTTSRRGFHAEIPAFARRRHDCHGWLYPRAAYWVLDANRVTGRMGATAFLPEEERETESREASPPHGVRPPRTIWCIDLRASDSVAALVAEIERILFVSGRLAACRRRPASRGPARLFEEQLTGAGIRWSTMAAARIAGSA